MPPIRARHGGARQRRVEQCLELLMGRRSAYYSQPTWMYFPELPAIEFFERDDFPWLDVIEAASEQIRAEVLRVLAADREGLQPYMDFPLDMPLDQFRELNRSRRWSAYFLWNQGRPDGGHLARCPVPRVCWRSAALRDRGTGADSLLFDPRRQYPHSRAHGRHQHPLHVHCR